MDIVIITTATQIVQRLLAHMLKDAHATRQLHCQLETKAMILRVTAIPAGCASHCPLSQQNKLP